MEANAQRPLRATVFTQQKTPCPSYVLGPPLPAGGVTPIAVQKECAFPWWVLVLVVALVVVLLLWMWMRGNVIAANMQTAAAQQIQVRWDSWLARQQQQPQPQPQPQLMQPAANGQNAGAGANGSHHQGGYALTPGGGSNGYYDYHYGHHYGSDPMDVGTVPFSAASTGRLYPLSFKTGSGAPPNNNNGMPALGFAGPQMPSPAGPAPQPAPSKGGAEDMAAPPSPPLSPPPPTALLPISVGAGKVQTLTSATMSALAQQGIPFFVMYCMQGCIYCERAIGEFAKVAQQFPGLVVGVVDRLSLRPEDRPSGYPHFVLSKADGSRASYAGQRTAAAFSCFIQAHLGAALGPQGAPSKPLTTCPSALQSHDSGSGNGSNGGRIAGMYV